MRFMLKPANEPTTVHGKRVARKQELRERGIPVTKPSYITLVEPSVIAMPEWARKRAVKGLPVEAGRVWLRRSDAIMLARLDREDGGRPTVLRVEYRQCPVCKRVLLGELAKARRMLEESYRTANQLPCSRDCETRFWRKDVQ